jgi:mRNA-degrading endonuclease toxin of MazEF toxin-antitoxin module
MADQPTDLPIQDSKQRLQSQPHSYRGRVCAHVQSQTRRAPGNVLLNPGEANLAKPSVVNISQIFTIDRSQLAEKIGTLSLQRVRQILDGLYLLLEPSHYEE